jgi:hypothetical protein
MATSGSKRTGRLADAGKAVPRDSKTGTWAFRTAVTGRYTELKKHAADSFKSVPRER